MTVMQVGDISTLKGDSLFMRQAQGLGASRQRRKRRENRRY
jgi:hypothetical protein